MASISGRTHRRLQPVSGSAVRASRTSVRYFLSTSLRIAAWALLSKMGTMGLWKCRYFETNEVKNLTDRWLMALASKFHGRPSSPLTAAEITS